MAQNFQIVGKIALQGPQNIRAVVRQLQNQLNSVKATVQVGIGNNVNSGLNRLNTNLQRVDANLRSIRQSGLNAAQALQQLSSAIGTVRTNANGIVTLQKNLSNTSKAANNASNAMASFGGQAGLAVRRFLAFAAPTSIFLGLVAAIKNGVAEAIDFEKEMVRVSQVTGRSVASLSDLSGEITRLATSLGTSSKELGNVATTLAQAGLNAKDTKIALEALARSSLAATFTGIEQTTEGAIAVFRQFGVSARDLQGVIGSLNAVSAQFAVESDDLVSAIRRTGGAFKVSGGNLNELLGLFTSVRATTRESADSIATGFRTIFTRVQRPRTIQFLRELGVELQDIKGQFVGPVEAIRRLNLALEGIATTDPRFAAVIEELGGFRQVSKVIPLIQQFPEALKAISVAEQGQLSIVEDSITAQKSLANQIVKVKEEFLALFRELSSDKSFQFFAKSTLEISRNLIDVTRALKPLIPLLGSLALIGVGRGIGSVSSNFASALSGRKKFASGGIVPGSGNGDTVPAMLTPGEFVVNKKSAAAVGFSNLARMNKFADGGPVRKFAIAALTPPGVNRKEVFPVKTNVSVGGKRQAINETIDLTIASPSKKFSKNAENIIRKQVGIAASSVATGIQKSIGAEGSAQPANLTGILKKAGFDAVVGHIFEASLALAGAPYLESSSTSLDFPQGLGQVAKVFGDNFPTNDPTDAKRTATSKDFKRRNLITFLKSEALKKAGVTSKPTLSTTPTGSVAGVKSGTKMTAQQLGILLGAPGLKFSQLSQLDQVKSAFNVTRAGGAASFIKKASGGSIGGSGSEDNVPALLTPGEFVINKKSAKALGIGTLNKLNKFARGGAVKNTGVSGTTGAFVATAALQGIPALFGELDEEGSKFLRALTAMGVAATAATFGLRSLASEKKVDLANRILNARGKVGLGGSRVPNSGPQIALAQLTANLDKLSIGIGITSGALATFGQSLQDSATSAAKLATSQQQLDDAIIKDKRGSALAGAGTGIGAGAAIGTAIAPGIGTAIGAAVGGIAGTIVGAINNNQKELIKAFRQAKFDKVSESLDTVFEELSSGRITRPSAAIGLRSSLSGQISNIRGTSDLEQRGELTKQFRGNLVNIRTFSQSIAAQSDNLNEFENAFGGTGRILIDSIGLLTKKSIPDVRREIEKEIKAHKDVAEAADKRARADKDAAVLTVSIRTFADALQNVTDSLNSSQTAFDNLESLSSGSAISGKFNSVPAGFFGRAAAGSISNAGSVSSAVRSLVGPLNSNSGKAIEETAVSVAKLTNSLPDILERVAAGTGIGGDTERASELFEKEIDNLGGEVSNSLKSVVKSIFGSELASRQGGGESGAIQNIREDLLGLVNKLVPEAIRKSVESLDEVNKNLQDQIDIIGKRLVQQANLEFNISKQKVSLEEKIFDITKSRLKEGERLTFGQVQASAARRRNELAPGIGGVGAAGARLATIQGQVKVQNEIVNAEKSSLEERAQANKKLVELGDESNRLREYLRDLGDSTLELTHLQEELGRAEADRKSGRSLVEGLLFGGGKDRVSFNRFTRNAQDISSGRKNIGSLGPQQRAEFLDFLDKLPQNKKLGLLGGQNVEDFRKDQLRKSFIARAGAEGADVGRATDLINELTNTTKEEDAITRQLIDVQNTSVDATRTLIDADRALAKVMDELNKQTLADLPRAIQSAIAESAIAGFNVQSGTIRNQITERQGKVADVGNLLQDFGINLEQANLVKNQESRLRDLIKNRKEIGEIQGININTGQAASDLRIRAGGKAVSAEDINAVVTPLLQTISSPEIRDQLEKQIISRFESNPSSGFGDINRNLSSAVSNFKSSRTNVLGLSNQNIESRLSSIRGLVPKFTDEDTLNKFINGFSNLDSSLTSGRVKLDDYVKGIQNLNAQLIDIQNVIAGLRPTPAAPKASGGIINGRGISNPLVRFAPTGTDTIPAMLTAGEFVVNKGATAANLPLLQEINAQGFADGGRVIPRFKRIEAILQKRRGIRAERKGATAARFTAKKEARLNKISARLAASQERTEFSKDRQAMIANRGALADSLVTPGRALKGEDAFEDRQRRFRDIEARINVTGDRRIDEVARIKRENELKIQRRFQFGGGGFALGGAVPGSGNGDTVPAMLTPGEFVLNKRAVRALGMSTLSSFNKKFANGGPVQASGGSSSLALDSQSISALENFNKSAANLSRFAETNTMLANALSTWSNSASKLTEAMASFPSEVQINHSPIPVNVNVSGLEGFKSTIVNEVMTAVDARLNNQKAKASDGKSPFFAGK